MRRRRLGGGVRRVHGDSSRAGAAIVPDLAGLTIREAQIAVDEVGLELGGVSGAGDLIRGQGPLPGTEVPRGTAVDVALGAPDPQLVTVPNLVGIDVDDAPRILDSRGLALGQTSGDGDVIRSQSPPAGARVSRGSAVDVSAGSAPSPGPARRGARPRERHSGRGAAPRSPTSGSFSATTRSVTALWRARHPLPELWSRPEPRSP